MENNINKTIFEDKAAIEELERELFANDTFKNLLAEIEPPEDLKNSIKQSVCKNLKKKRYSPAKYGSWVAAAMIAVACFVSLNNQPEPQGVTVSTPIAMIPSTPVSFWETSVELDSIETALDSIEYQICNDDETELNYASYLEDIETEIPTNTFWKG